MCDLLKLVFVYFKLQSEKTSNVRVSARYIPCPWMRRATLETEENIRRAKRLLSFRIVSWVQLVGDRLLGLRMLFSGPVSLKHPVSFPWGLLTTKRTQCFCHDGLHLKFTSSRLHVQSLLGKVKKMLNLKVPNNFTKIVVSRLCRLNFGENLFSRISVFVSCKLPRSFLNRSIMIGSCASIV